MKKILTIAPHPDDETRGCGGTLLRHLAAGDEVHWLIVTSITTSIGFSAERVASRDREIEVVAQTYGFHSTRKLDLPTMRLDQVPKLDLVSAISEVVRDIQPDTLLIPYRNDAHSDHTAVYDAASACSKSFRYPSVKAVYAYETLSETEFGLKPEDPGFRPNLLVDISTQLDQKIEIMSLFAGEMESFPFPRSEVCIRALAQLRGSQAGTMAAEAFMIMKEIR